MGRSRVAGRDRAGRRPRRGARRVRRRRACTVDVLPLSVATDGAIAALGVDRRRLRPNLFIAGVDGLGERSWPGRTLRIGDALVAAVKMRGRCVMTTFDPDTLEQDHGVLRRIVREFDGVTSVDSYILRPGRIRVGDPVELLP